MHRRIGDTELRDVHLAPYTPSLRAGALTVMASYSSLNGQKVRAAATSAAEVMSAGTPTDGLKTVPSSHMDMTCTHDTWLTDGVHAHTAAALVGQQVHASYELLTNVLRHELGFEGLVVSDYNAVQQCAPSFDEALIACVNAGVDMVSRSRASHSAPPPPVQGLI